MTSTTTSTELVSTTGIGVKFAMALKDATSCIAVSFTSFI